VSTPELAESVFDDPYAIRPGEVRWAPRNLLERVRYLGPSVVASAAVVGSGELLLTSSLGGAAGIVLLWWVILSCWSKSIVQAELGRYILTTGDTYLRALGRLPGRIPGPRGPVAWPIWLQVLFFGFGVVLLGAIVGGAGQALELLVPGMDRRLAAAAVALVALVLLASGSYRSLERLMLAMVVLFTATTLACAIAMQFTEFGITLPMLSRGFEFEFPTEHFVLALGVYGITGLNAGENAAYSYWCIEKGYPSFIGADKQDPGWTQRAIGWIKVLQTDVWLTVIILTLATVPFFILGAGVLHQLGVQPGGSETISSLSKMFTRTLGQWAVWVFGFGAFLILFSTTVAGIAIGGRFLPEYLIELGFIERGNLRLRLKITRGYILAAPALSLALYLLIERPVQMATALGVVAAVMLPIQSGATLWLQSRHMDARVRPGRVPYAILWLVFGFQAVMSCLVIWYVALG
jgi:Mn2+/Fe2+ NRAMP family transporter